jgi:hypothetical protein
MPTTSSSKTALAFGVSIAALITIAMVIAGAFMLFPDKEAGRGGKPHAIECLDSMTIIVLDTSNEHHTCQNPEQKIEIYPAGRNKHDSPSVLVKCVCQRKEKLLTPSSF